MSMLNKQKLLYKLTIIIIYKIILYIYHFSDKSSTTIFLSKILHIL